MSRIYFHGKHHESGLRGSERAHAGIICQDLAIQVLDLDGHLDAGNPINRLIVGEPLLPWPGSGGGMRSWSEAIRMRIGSSFYSTKLRFGGEEHHAFDLALNTIIATGSPYLAFFARMHGTCEIHGWIDESDREWLADLIDDGRARNIFRPDQGWEDVSAHARNGDGGPLVMSYSVCDSFPNTPRDWSASAWPEHAPWVPYTEGQYDDWEVEARKRYNALSDEERNVIEERSQEWYDLPEDEQWDTAMAALRSQESMYLQIGPDNITTQRFMGGATLWDAAQSEEYRQFYKDANAASQRRIEADQAAYRARQGATTTKGIIR